MNNQDYIPYGEEWEKEMSKFPKPSLIKMLGDQLKKTSSEQGSDGWIKGLRAILQECDEYLSAEIYEKGKPVYLNSIGANSVLHTKIKAALTITRPTPPQSKE